MYIKHFAKKIYIMMLVEGKTSTYFDVKLSLEKISHVCARAHVRVNYMKILCALGMCNSITRILDKKFT